MPTRPRRKPAPARPPGELAPVYQHKAALNDPAHPEHAEILRWVGGKLDPEAIDLAGINKHLKKLAKG